jgi:hypothetical protein
MALSALERGNLLEIEGLNQRGGRTLSVLDLLDAGTLDLEIAAYLIAVVCQGASVLTAARPGGAGKSTLLADLLCFLPAGVRVKTISPSHPREGAGSSAARRTCHLAHEIGPGAYYGYLWGNAVRRFFSLARAGQLIASCLHADTVDEVEETLLGELDVDERDLRQVDVIAFMHLDFSLRQPRRRVASVWEASPGGHRQIFAWDPGTDRFVRVADSPRADAGTNRWRQFLETSHGRDQRRVTAFRESFLEELARGQP